MHTESTSQTQIDVDRWKGILKRVGHYLAQIDFVDSSVVGLPIEDRTIYMVNSEGSRINHGNRHHSMILRIPGMSNDGMDLSRNEI